MGKQTTTTGGGVMELPKVQPKMIICWYIIMTATYQKTYFEVRN